MKKLLAFCFMVCCAVAQAQLVTYPEGLKTGMPHNDDYTVRVRVPGGEWKDLFEYNVQVDMDRVQDASMVQFDMGSLVEVMVKKNNGTIHEVDIRPQVNDIRYVQYKNVITFMLDKPRYLSVEFNGDRLHNLHVFANPMETETYSKEEKGVMYFGPGVHRPKDLPNNQIRIPSNTTVYLAPGAVVKAKLWVDKAENVRIVGRGILDHPIRGIEITDSKNVVVDGITVINPDHYTVFGGGSVGVTIRNLKSFSCKGWSDGIDMMCCHDVLIDNVFMRNSDDCIALYNHRWNWWGGSDNITVQNSILWADIAHPINVGGHGDPESLIGETIENLIFRNIDILEHDEDDVPYQGCMAIDAGDRNRVKNILFEDIRVESIQEGKLFHINIRFNPKYDKQPGQSIDGVTFRNSRNLTFYDVFFLCLKNKIILLLFLTINNIFVQILYAMSEKELIILLKNGDEKAFTTLYRLYWSKVYNFSRLYLSSITEVEEVVQEVFVKVWETRDFLRADDNFKGYLFIITRNLIFNQFRKSFNENAYKLTVLSAAMDYYDMEDELSAADLKEFIKRMVGELPPRQQEVFKMSRDEHLTYKEIATRLNISEKTVERHINEAIKFLKKNIMLYLIFIF